MRLTIIPADKAVYKDGISFSGLDLTVVPTNIHALQWHETEGEVEFIGRPKPQNEIISELPAWANACIDKWNEAKTAQDVTQKAAQQATANQPTTGLATA
jgi:hypothetical protein